MHAIRASGSSEAPVLIINCVGPINTMIPINPIIKPNIFRGTISLLFNMKCERGRTNSGTTAIVTPAKPELT